MGLKNVYFKTNDDGVWKLLADNMEFTYTQDGTTLTCDEQNNYIQATPYEDFESYDFEEEKEMNKCCITVDRPNNCICKEEKEMNKILQLYAGRKEKEIHDKYEKLVEEEYNEIEFVKVYNNLVNTFEGALQELFEDETNVGCKYMTDTGSDRNTYKYRLASGRIQNEIREKYNEDIREELDELHTLVNEVETMLSLANNGTIIDNDKIQEILINYGIINADLMIQA